MRKEEEVPADMEQEVKDTIPSKTSKMEEISLCHDLRPINIEQEVAQQEMNFCQADESCYVQDPNGVLEVQQGKAVELTKKTMPMTKSKSIVSSKEVTEEIPESPCDFDEPRKQT